MQHSLFGAALVTLTAVLVDLVVAAAADGVDLHAAAAAEQGNHWAVLVAGSKGWYNYRHQSDMCHAFHLLKQSGYDTSRIITMLYDDVATSPSNPYHGKLFNYPYKSLRSAVDVYKDCQKDYTGSEVTPDKFLSVLTGDAVSAGGKVLESTAQDHVFVYFVDHGGVGLIAFPDDSVLHAKQLVDALKQMYADGKYGKLVFYLETCESGSMFEGLLPRNLPVYAMAASSATESSWATYCGDAATVAGKNIGACLADLFSVNWLHDSEHAGMRETLGKQFARVKRATNLSHVMRYGQVAAFSRLPVGDFEGGERIQPPRPVVGPPPEPKLANDSAISSRDATLKSLEHVCLCDLCCDAATAEKLRKERQRRKEADALGEAIERGVRTRFSEESTPIEGFPWAFVSCHERAVDAFGKACGWSEVRLKLSSKLYKLCSQTRGIEAPVIDAIKDSCPIAQSETAIAEVSAVLV